MDKGCGLAPVYSGCTCRTSKPEKRMDIEEGLVPRVACHLSGFKMRHTPVPPLGTTTPFSEISPFPSLVVSLSRTSEGASFKPKVRKHWGRKARMSLVIMIMIDGMGWDGGAVSEVGERTSPGW